MLKLTSTRTTVEIIDGDDVAQTLETMMDWYRRDGWRVARSAMMRPRFKAVKGDMSVEIELEQA